MSVCRSTRSCAHCGPPGQPPRASTAPRSPSIPRPRPQPASYSAASATQVTNQWHELGPKPGCHLPGSIPAGQPPRDRNRPAVATYSAPTGRGVHPSLPGPLRELPRVLQVEVEHVTCIQWWHATGHNSLGWAKKLELRSGGGSTEWMHPTSGRSRVRSGSARCIAEFRGRAHDDVLWSWERRCLE